MDSLRAYVDELLLQRTRPFLLRLDAARRVAASSGDGAPYGLDKLSTGQSLVDDIPFLLGLEGPIQARQVIEFWETPSGGAAHVHILPMSGGLGLVFLDATEERNRQRRHQQAAHELALLQHQRERLVRELEQSEAKLAEANRLKGLFIARMSHEFRTPLCSILGYGDLLRENLQDHAAARQDLSAITRGANYLLNLVENLLDQARSDHEKLPLQPRSTTITDLIAELDQMFRPIAEQKHLELRWQRSPQLPERLWIDGLRLRQILINLLGNALKFTRSGSVTVALHWRDERLDVQIADTGPGIPEALQPNLFEPFHQGDYSKGAGLGLSISRLIARRMGGELRLHQTSPDGTKLVLDIPAPCGALQSPLPM
jgi:signal transduction histidine kinase